MVRLPPAEKLPLALRKNIRDNFEAKKPDFEKQLSDKLGTAWTIDINPNALFPYAKETFAKENLGGAISAYVQGTLSQIGFFFDVVGASGIQELNDIAHAHVLTMDVDEAGANPYSGCAIHDGKLVILFNEKYLGTNANTALQTKNLKQALNTAPPPAGASALSFKARASVRDQYDVKIGDLQKKIGQQLDRPDIQLVPNFESTYATLKAGEAQLRKDWEDQLGFLLLEYFDGFRFVLETKEFAKDEMLREGFNEAVDKGIVEFRIVDKLKYGTYNEVVIEDGKLYIQTILKYYNTNVKSAANKIVDQL